MSAHATWRLFVVALAMSHLHLSWQVVVQPPADFFANIDGSSIATGMSHHCAIALAHGDDYGGTAYCWGDNEMGATEAPKEVYWPIEQLLTPLWTKASLSSNFSFLINHPVTLLCVFSRRNLCSWLLECFSRVE